MGQVVFSHLSHKGSQKRSHPSLGPCVRMHSVKVPEGSCCLGQLIPTVTRKFDSQGRTEMKWLSLEQRDLWAKGQ